MLEGSREFDSGPAGRGGLHSAEQLTPGLLFPPYWQGEEVGEEWDLEHCVPMLIVELSLVWSALGVPAGNP